MKRNLIVIKNHLVGKLIIMFSLIIIPACAFLNSFSAQVKVNTINLDGDVFAVVIDGQDMQVFQLGDDLGFLLKAFDKAGILGEMGRENF